MQIIFKDENERSSSRGTNIMDIIIYVGRISRCMKGELVGRFRNSKSRIWVSRGIFVGSKKRIWRGNEEVVKMAKLKRREQERRTIEEFV